MITQRELLFYGLLFFSGGVLSCRECPQTRTDDTTFEPYISDSTYTFNESTIMYGSPQLFIQLAEEELQYIIDTGELSLSCKRVPDDCLTESLVLEYTNAQDQIIFVEFEVADL